MEKVKKRGHRRTQSTGVAVDAPPEFKGHEGSLDPGASFRGFVEHLLMLTFPGDRGKFQAAAGEFLLRQPTASWKKWQGGNYQFTEVVGQTESCDCFCAMIWAGCHGFWRRPKKIVSLPTAIKIAIKLEPEIFHHQTQTSPCPLG